MKRKIALLLALIMILSLPMSAFGVTKYTGPVNATIVKEGSVQDGARIVVEIPWRDVEAAGIPEGVTDDVYDVHMRVALTGAKFDVDSKVKVVSNDMVDVDDVDVTKNDKAFTLTLENFTNLTPKEDATFTFMLEDLKITGKDGAVTATLEGRPGNDLSEKAITKSTVTLYNVGEGKAEVWADELYNITDSNLLNDVSKIIIKEDVAGSLKDDKTITLRLPRGFYWDIDADVKITNDANSGYGIDESELDEAKINYKNPQDNVVNKMRDVELTISENWLNVESRSRFAIEGLRIIVDPRLAKFGEVTVTVGGTASVSTSSFAIANYGDFDAEIKALTAPTVMAGQFQEIGEFEIREAIAGSLREGDRITVTLPEGVKWRVPAEGHALPTGDGVGEGAPKLNTSDSELEGIKFNIGGKDNSTETVRWVIQDNERRTLRASLGNEFNSDRIDGKRDGALMIFEEMNVAIDSQFRGDLKVEVRAGSAVEEIVLAKVVPAVEVEITEVAEVKLGLRDQKVGDILITETAPGAIARTEHATGVIELNLEGYDFAGRHKFAKTPTAVVEEGDLTIEKIWMSADRSSIHIQTTSDSEDEASVIRVTDVELTLDRTAPEGEIELFVGGDGIVNAGTWAVGVGEDGENTDTTGGHRFFRDSAWLTSTPIAKVVTPADQEVVNPEVVLTIGSTTMYVDGVATTANAAPYIDEANRTMLPLKAIGAVLGADVDWNEATRTVLVTKGSDRVLVTIDNDVMNVNGMQIPMRSKAVINNSRTFVPLKDLGVALGVSVEWDAAEQSVTVK